MVSMAAAQVLVSNLKFDVTDESELVELFGGPKSVVKAEVQHSTNEPKSIQPPSQSGIRARPPLYAWVMMTCRVLG